MNVAEFDEFKRASWRDIRTFWNRARAGELTRDDDPQPKLAAAFFEIFVKETDPAIRRKALDTAFLMWGNTASAGQVDDALAQLDAEADYWDGVLHGMSNAYARSGRRDDIMPRLHELETRLTHAKSRSGVLLALGRHYLHVQPDAATPYFNEVCRLAADAQSVVEADGALYEIRSLRIGLDAPDFRADTIDGRSIALRDFRGSVVCLEFWDTGCGPCWAEFKTLRGLRQKYPPPSLHVIGVSSDRDPNELSAVIERERLDWLHIREEDAWHDSVIQLGSIRRLYNVWGIPASFLIDQAGRIAATRFRGNDLVRAARELMAGSE